MKTYFKPQAMMSQRRSGFKSTANALAELVDNAFDANADEVKIIFVERSVNNRPKVDQIIIADNGRGMDAEELQNAVIFGHSGETNMQRIVETKRIGKFGYGLPNASISQCLVTHVYSWKNKNEVFYNDIDLLRIQKDDSIEVPLSVAKKLPTYVEEEILKDISESGTVIIWNQCDLVSNTRAMTLEKYSEKLLGRIYRYLLHSNEKKITFYTFRYNNSNHKYIQDGGTEVARPEDPLFLMENTTASSPLWAGANSGQVYAEFYKPFAISEKECKATSLKFKDHCYISEFQYEDKNYEYEIITSIVDQDIQKPGLRNGGDIGIGHYYRDKERNGNIYMVRSEREVDCGTFGDFYHRTQPNNRFWTIEIKFNPDMDELFGVNVNKQQVAFRQTEDRSPYDPGDASFVEAQNAFFTKLSDQIKSAVVAVYKQIGAQAKEFDVLVPGPEDGKPTIPVGTPTTTVTIITTEGTRTGSLSLEDKEQLTQHLHEKYPKIDKKDIFNSLISLDESGARACVIYVPLETEQLWTYTKMMDFHVIEINSNHTFYEKVILRLQEMKDEGSLTAIELFIVALVIEEENQIQNDQRKRIIESYRLATAVKLKEFMNDLSESFSVKPDSE
jgi:hypothetical protein